MPILLARTSSPPSSTEQSTPTHFGFSSESTSPGKEILSLSHSSIKYVFSSPSLSKTPMEQTKDFESYIGELLENRIIGNPQLIRFIEHLEKGELINPISEEKARTSTASLIQYRGLQQHLDKASLNQKELLDWARATLAKRARVQVKREEAQEETRDIYRKLEFHPVKRPISFKMRNGVKHKPVTLTYPIEVQSTPLTQNQWVEIMGENPSYFAKGDNSVFLNFHGKSIELQPDNPVEHITWWSALVFANRLSEKHSLPLTYDLSHIIWEPGTRAENGTLIPAWGFKGDSDITNKYSQEVRIYVKGKSYDPYEDGDAYYQTEGYRLPTLAEQMYMLQGGGKTKGDNLFRKHAKAKKHAWHSYNNSDDTTQPVGLLQPIVINKRNFYDLYGNVEEWGLDRYIPYNDLQDGKNPINKEGNSRIASGGHWHKNSGGDYLSATRPRSTYNGTGFRLVRTIEQSESERNGGE